MIQFKLDYERRNNEVLSAAQVYRKWVANVQFSSLATGEKAFKQSFVDSCITVYTRVLCIEELQQIILQGEEKTANKMSGRAYISLRKFARSADKVQARKRS